MSVALNPTLRTASHTYRCHLGFGGDSLKVMDPRKANILLQGDRIR